MKIMLYENIQKDYESKDEFDIICFNYFLLYFKFLAASFRVASSCFCARTCLLNSILATVEILSLEFYNTLS